MKSRGNRIMRENYTHFRPYLPAIEALLMSNEIQSVPDHEMQDISVLDMISSHNKDFLGEVLDKKPNLISHREKEILLPIYEKSWKGELNVKNMLEGLIL